MARPGSSVTRLLHVSALLLTAILLGPALAHLFEMPGKLRLGHDDYMAVQQIYRGWALFAVPIVLNLGVVAALAYQTRGTGTGAWSLTALLCLIAAQVVFWVWTYPANAETSQWTVLPENWEELRRQWEFSHAAGAVFTIAAFVCLTLVPMAQLRAGLDDRSSASVRSVRERAPTEVEPGPTGRGRRTPTPVTRARSPRRDG